MDDIIRIFSEFEIERIRHIDDCYFDGSIKNNKHYYLTAKLLIEFQEKFFDSEVHR